MSSFNRQLYVKLRQLRKRLKIFALTSFICVFLCLVSNRTQDECSQVTLLYTGEKWTKTKGISFECHNCLPLNFPAEGQFYWRCWFEYRAIRIKPHRNKGRGFRRRKKSVRIHLQLLVTESHTDRCHPFTKLPQYAGFVIFFWFWDELSSCYLMGSGETGYGIANWGRKREK